MKSELTLIDAQAATVRREMIGGRSHLVMPVIALKEGVIHAMNSSADELVPYDEMPADGWDKIPVFINHPLRNNSPVSAKTPGVMREAVGFVRNAGTHAADKTLRMEACVDEQKAPKSFLDRIASNPSMDVSVGVMTATDHTAGEYNGKPYASIWRNIKPDHLALLPEITGACSWDMGCGVRAASTKMRVNSKGDQMGPNEKAHSDAAAAHTTASEAHEQAAVAHMPYSMVNNEQAQKATEDAVDATSTSMAATRGTQMSDANGSADMADYYAKNAATNAAANDRPSAKDAHGSAAKAHARAADMHQKAADAFKAGAHQSDPEKNAGLFVRMMTAAKEFIAATGARNSSADKQRIQEMHDKSVELGADCATSKAAAGTCGCQSRHAANNEDHKETDMDRKEIAKFLETATDEQVKALAAAAKPPTEAEIKAAADAKAKVDSEFAKTEDARIKAAAEAAVKSLTFEQLVAAAKPEMRDSINAGLKAAEARKAESIKALKESKRCSFSDDELKAMSQSNLDTLVELAQVKPAYASAPVTPRDGQDGGDKAKTVPAAQDLNAAIKAAAAAKSKK